MAEWDQASDSRNQGPLAHSHSGLLIEQLVLVTGTLVGVFAKINLTGGYGDRVGESSDRLCDSGICCLGQDASAKSAEGKSGLCSCH